MHRKKTILIISEYFAPISSIASIRFTKIVKYLSRMNKYKFVIIARKSDDNLDAILEHDLKEMRNSGSVSVYYINIQDNIIDNIRKIKKSKKGTIINGQSSNMKFKPYEKADFKERVYKMANTIKYIYNERNFAKRGMWLIRLLNIDFDYVISSYGDAGTHFLALRYIKKNKKVRWIADYRDSVIAYYRPPVFNPFFLSILKQTRDKAYAITGVTSATMGSIANERKSIVIRNGFDREDILKLKKSSLVLEKSKFHICYTGRIYAEKTDAEIFFKSLRDLCNNKIIDISDLQIDYAGNDFELLYQQALKYHLGNVMKNHGFLQRIDALEMQRQSQLLITLVWNDEGDTLSGKLMEYLMAERNILAIVTGNKSNSSIDKILKSSNAGYCFEEAKGIKEQEKLKKFITALYEEYKTTGDTIYKGDKMFLDKYSYENIALRFSKLIDS